MSDHGYRIAVIGATGLLGGELLSLLESSELPIRDLVPMASPGCTEPALSFRGDDYPIRNLTPEDMDGVDIAFTAMPAEAGRPLLLEAAEAGCMVIDLAGLALHDASIPVHGLGLRPEELDSARERGMVISPGPVALGLAAIGAAIQQNVGLAAIRGTAIVSASQSGRAGVDELSRQVAAMFNSQDPPRAVFEDGLAFDLVPAIGKGSSWTAPELIAGVHAARMLGIPSQNISVSMVVAPLFVGMGLSLHVLTERPATAEDVEAVFKETPAIELVTGEARRRLMPRAQLGHTGVRVGRIRDDHAQQGVHLWASADPIHLAAANAVGILNALIQAELV